MVFFEPWVESIGEVGVQIEVPHDDEPYIIGWTLMLVDSRGQYAGSWFKLGRKWASEDESHDWGIAADMAMKVAKRVQQIGYFGPLGIDAMRYRGRNGSIRLRPLQDINVRWTMGRLSFGFHKLASPREIACWHHGNHNVRSRDGLSAIRLIATSPKTVGGTECGHTSRIVFSARILEDDLVDANR